MADLTYVRFRRLAAELARAQRTSIEMVFEPIGLMVQAEGARFDYWCTPTNNVTFAGTGGDGVHFGHVLTETRPTSPVVMTVPMTDSPNLVIADDFYDFLRLGYFAGFFSLEQFVYNWDEAVAIHTRGDDEWGDREKALLRRLRVEFSLEPFADNLGPDPGLPPGVRNASSGPGCRGVEFEERGLTRARARARARAR